MGSVKKNFYVGLCLAVLLVVGGAYLSSNKVSNRSALGKLKKSPHFESSTPEHGATLAGVPLNVVIDFNFDLATNSSISVTRADGQEFAVGETTIDENKLVLRRKINPDAPDGVYTAAYRACWADGSCHDGHWQFSIDKSLASTYEDMRGKSEVVIDMAQIKFKPKNIRIDRGTKVTWKNSDSVDHFVNTDSHPAHTYYVTQNSRSLSKDATYAMAFDTVGIYPYHCSAHAATMLGNILVES